MRRRADASAPAGGRRRDVARSFGRRLRGVGAAQLSATNWRQGVAPIGFHARAEVRYKASAFDCAANDRRLARDNPDLGIACALPLDRLAQQAVVFAGLSGQFRGIA
jgi:hypothetical protein